MNICVVGTGYVGLVTGTCLADFGHTVICVDNDPKKVDLLNNGGVPIYEIGLDDLIKRNTKEKRLSFTTDLGAAVKHSLVIFNAVGTPSRADGTANLDYVFQVAREVAEHLDGYKVIVTKSTVPVGTGAKVKALIEEVLEEKTAPEYLNAHPEANGKKPRFDIASNPEFLREGSAIEDFMRPNRVVIGAASDSAFAIMEDIYRPLYLLETPLVMTNIETAELIKYAANAFLATKISFINEIGLLAEKVGANIDDLAKGVGLDQRIGKKFLHVSPGYGGSCFPKDTSALLHIADDAGYDMKIVKATVAVNARQKQLMVTKIESVMGGVKGKTVGVLGLAFKPNTDDMRDSASITILNSLRDKGAAIRAFDPVAMDEAKKYITGITYVDSAYAAIEGADCLLLLTEWNEFRFLDLMKVKELLNAPLFIDLRNIYEPEKMICLGFEYVSLGRGHIKRGGE
jgi:UDPglucose 6-dehydrogenase